MSAKKVTALTSYRDLILGNSADKSKISSESFPDSMEQILRRYVLKVYPSLETFGNEIGLAKSTIYDYFKDNCMPDDIFAMICFSLRLEPVQITHLISMGTKFRLDYNGIERNSIIVNNLLKCGVDPNVSLESCNEELKAHGLQEINRNA